MLGFLPVLGGVGWWVVRMRGGRGVAALTMCRTMIDFVNDNRVILGTTRARGGRLVGVRNFHRNTPLASAVGFLLVKAESGLRGSQRGLSGKLPD